ncbi:S-type pyocin domain-containing protein [Pseudomonas wadenswilerensis]
MSVNLPPIPVDSTRLRPWRLEHHFIPRYHFIPRHGLNLRDYATGQISAGTLVIELAKTVQKDRQDVEQDHANRQKQLDSQLNAELKALTAPVSNTSDPFESYERKAVAIKGVLEQKRSALPAAWESARVFFGEDPVGKSFADYLRVANRPNGFPDPKKTWLASYKAAFEARLLAQSIDRLTARANRVAVERLKALGRLHAVADQLLAGQIRTVELAQAGLDEARFQHHVDLREMEERLEQFSRHQSDDITPDTAALHARDVAEEIVALLRARNAARSSRTATQDHVRTLHTQRNFLHQRLTSGDPQHASEQNRADREALYQAADNTLKAHEETWPEEQQRMAAHEEQLEAALAKAREELVRLAALEGVEVPQRPATYTATVASLGMPQVVTPSASSMAAFESMRPALARALLSVGSKLPSVPGAVVKVASLMLFSLKLDEGERWGLSVPLTDMKIGFDRQGLMDALGETFPLPMRLISDLVGDDSAIQIVSTGTEAVPADVPVRAATWDASVGAYSFTTEGPGPITVLWTPQAPPGNSSTTLPGELPLASRYPGYIGVKNAPKILDLPAVDDLHFDDYIVTFPADSGLEPVYIMFKNPRDYAGIVIGSGRTIAGWREAMNSPEGAPIPPQIADQLRGRTFSRWRQLRRAIWKAIGEDAELRNRFSAAQQDSLKNRRSPVVPSSQRVGGRKVYELHHIHPIAKGGAVYDLDNLIIMTPREHIDLHKREGK